MNFILTILAAYLLGSVPFALVIGKVFFKKDIRQFGSGNLGGGNAGRVLGKKAGLAVMTCDILKVTLAIYIASLLGEGELILVAAGLAAAIGHCFPVFANFKGGKAVATMYGFLFGMAIIGGYGLKVFLFPLIVFLVVLYLWKIIALASMVSAAAVTAFVFVISHSVPMLAALSVFTILMVIRHKANIIRMIHHEENKISWM